MQSLEELRMLLNMEMEGKQVLKIFMLGQDELCILLESEHREQVRQTINATYHLRALEREERRGCILHRLKTAGWNNDPSFTEDIFDEIFKLTAGGPLE